MRRHILFSPDVDEVPHPPRLRSDFQCPEEDTQGSSLTGQGTGTGVTSTNHGSTSETTFICFYDHGAGRCSYAEDGSFFSGSSTCPDGTPETTPTSSTQIVTETQTQIVTQTAEPPPPPPPPTSSASSSEHLSRSSFSSSEHSATFPTPSPPGSQSSSSFPSSIPSQTSSILSSTSTSSPQVSTTNSPIAGPSALRSKNSLAAGAIAGITLAVILLILAVVIALCVRRSRRRQRDSDLQPESYFIVQSALQPSAPASMPTGAPSKSAQLTLTVAQNRQEYLTAQLRAVQKELETFQGNVGNSGNHLEQAMKQNDALRARIRMLEAEMQSQWGLGLTDSPPAYLAID